MEELLNFVQTKILENFPEVRWDIILTIQMMAFLAFRLLGAGTSDEPKWLSKRKAKTFTTLVISVSIIAIDIGFEYLRHGSLTSGYFKVMINSYILATSMYELGLFAIVGKVNHYADMAEESVQTLINMGKGFIKKRK
jgi:hypothetical protein